MPLPLVLDKDNQLTRLPLAFKLKGNKMSQSSQKKTGDRTTAADNITFFFLFFY